MANSGIKASQAGTALRSGFLRLAGPPKQATQAMAELGMSMSDITAQQQETKAALESLGISMSDTNGPRKMSAILTELRDKTAGLGQEEKLATLKMIFGTEAATGWLAVLDAGPETFNNLVDQMENSDGEAQKMADTMMNNTKGAMIQLKSAAEGLAISVGNVFLPSITSALKTMSGMAAAASAWVKAHENIVAAIGAVGAAVTGMVVGVQGIRLMGAAYGYVRANAVYLYQVIKNNAVAQRLFQAAVSGSTRAMAMLRAAFNSGMLQGFGQRILAAFNALRSITWGQIGTAMRAGITSGLSSISTALSQFGPRCVAAMAGARTAVANGAKAIASNAGTAARAVIAMVRSFSLAGAADGRDGIPRAGDGYPVRWPRFYCRGILAAWHSSNGYRGCCIFDLYELVDGRAFLYEPVESNHGSIHKRVDHDTAGNCQPAGCFRPAYGNAGAAACSPGRDNHERICFNQRSRGREQRGL